MEKRCSIKRRHTILLTDDDYTKLKRLTRKTGFSKAIQKAIEMLDNKEVQEIVFPVYIYDDDGQVIGLV